MLALLLSIFPPTLVLLLAFGALALSRRRFSSLVAFVLVLGLGLVMLVRLDWVAGMVMDNDETGWSLGRLDSVEVGAVDDLRWVCELKKEKKGELGVSYTLNLWGTRLSRRNWKDKNC